MEIDQFEIRKDERIKILESSIEVNKRLIKHVKEESIYYVPIEYEKGYISALEIQNSLMKQQIDYLNGIEEFPF